MTTTRTRVTKQAAAQQLADGLTKHQATIGDLIIAANKYAVAQAIALVLAPVATSKDVVIKRAALEASLEADRAAWAQNKGFVSSLKQTLQAMFAGQVDTLADFGLKGRKPRVVSPKTQVAAAARAKATRSLRGTKGSKQKLEVKAPPVAVTTTAAPAPEPAPAPAPSPAPAPAPAPKA
jgi:hypothetical protein